MESNWRNRAAIAIGEALGKFTEGGGDLIYLNSDDHEQVKKLIDDAYPFDQRLNHPYKVWLDERRKVFVALGIPVKQTHSCHSDEFDCPQLSLFSTRTKANK